MNKKTFAKAAKLAVASLVLASGLSACSSGKKNSCSSKHSCKTVKEQKSSCSSKHSCKTMKKEKSSCSAKKDKHTCKGRK